MTISYVAYTNQFSLPNLRREDPDRVRQLCHQGPRNGLAIGIAHRDRHRLEVIRNDCVEGIEIEGYGYLYCSAVLVTVLITPS